MQQKKLPAQANSPSSPTRYKKDSYMNDQIKVNVLPHENVMITNINWKVNDLIEYKYYINTVLHQNTSSCLKFVVTNLSLLRNLVMTVLQPNQLSILPQIVQTFNDWKVLSFHPNIVQIIGIDYVQKIPLILTEFLPCSSLRELILTRELYTPNEVTMSRRILHICLSIARALKFAHDRDVFHLNLKPSNILQMTKEAQQNAGPMETNERICVTDFGCVFLMAANSGCLDNFNAEALAQNFLFWPPFVVHLLQKWSQLKDTQDVDNEITDTLKKKIDLFGFGTILLFLLVGGSVWKSSSELNPDAVVRILESKLIIKMNPDVLGSLANLISNCIVIDGGFSSFDGVLANIQQIYNLNKDQLGEPSALEVIEQGTIEVADKFNLTVISDSITLDSRTDARMRYVKQEINKLKTSVPSPQAKKIQEKLFIKITYLENLMYWLKGQTVDYKILNSCSDFPLLKAFVYDAQRNASKAIDCYKEALKTVEDDRFMAILNRQQQLAREVQLNRKKRFYGHQKKNDIYKIRFTNNGKKALSFSKNDSILIWDLQGFNLPSVINEDNAISGDITEDGSLIMLGRRDGKILFLQKVNEPKQYEREEIQTHRSSIDTIVISQSGKYAVSVEAFSREVWIWDTSSKTTLGTIVAQSVIKAVSLSHNAHTILISETNSFNIGVYEKDSRKFTFQKKDDLKGHASHISHLKITMDAKMAVSAGVDGCFIVWNLDSNKFVKKITLEGLVLSLEITPMGKYVAIKTSQNKIFIYEALTNMFIKSFCFKGKNSGLAIQLEEISFDYLKQESEITFIKAWKESY